VEDVLKVKGICKRYSEFVLNDLSFTLTRGTILGMIGPNGAGKTTTIKIIMNFLQPDHGEVALFGEPFRVNEKALKNRIGYVGEEQYFYQNKTVDWTGRFVSQYYKNWDSKRFNSLLNDFEISGRKRCRELSKGMKVKLSLALALSHKPDLLILDEPTSGLDPVVRREVLDLLQHVCQVEEKTVLISSHITEDLSRIADRIMFLIHGGLVLQENKDELLSNWKRIHYKPKSLPEEVISRLDQVEDHVFGSTGITRDYESLSPNLKEGLACGDIKLESISLDDILISLVKGDSHVAAH